MLSLGFVPHVAKPADPLIERADKVLDDVHVLRVEVVTKVDVRAGRRALAEYRAAEQARLARR